TFDRRLGFVRSKPFDMDERMDERQLELDPLAARGRVARQGLQLRKGPLELFGGFHQSRAFERPLRRLSPQARSLFDQSGLGAMMRQQFGLVLGYLRKLALECIGDASGERASRVA